MASNFVVESWRANSVGTRLLRLWLGGTWVYAGVQKSLDAGFFDRASATYIGVQLANFAQNSPLGFLLNHLIEHATLVGWAVMLTELAIGIAVLAGVALQLAALGGAMVSLGLWLSASWTVYPYFLGSDSAYFVMWVALLLLLRAETGRAARAGLIPDLADRRNFMRIGLVAAAAVATGFGGAAISKVGKQIAQPSATPTESAMPTGSGKPSKSAKPANAIVALTALPVGGHLKYRAADGNPAFLFRTNAGVFAYSAICTHQGCVVGYSSSQKKLICPCHLGEYDPFDGAKVVNGPPPVPLATYKVAIDGDYVVSA